MIASSPIRYNFPSAPPEGHQTGKVKLALHQQTSSNRNYSYVKAVEMHSPSHPSSIGSYSKKAMRLSGCLAAYQHHSLVCLQAVARLHRGMYCQRRLRAHSAPFAKPCRMVRERQQRPANKPVEGCWNGRYEMYNTSSSQPSVDAAAGVTHASLCRRIVAVVTERARQHS